MNTATESLKNTGRASPAGETSGFLSPPVSRQLTLLPEDTLASLSATPGSEKARKTTAISGRSFGESLPISGSLGACLKRPGEPSGHVANGHSRQREEAPSRLGTSGSAGRERILADSQGGAVLPGLRESEQAGEWGRRSGDSGSQSGSLLSDAARLGRGKGRDEPENWGKTRSGVDCGHVPNADRAGCEEQHIAAVTTGTGLRSRPLDPGWCQWATEPGVGRVAHGIPRRVDRIKGLGNAVVPELVCEIGCAIRAAHYGGADV